YEMHRQGLDCRQGQTRREDIEALVEIHIEQGNILENEKLQAGVVHSIAGQRRYTVNLKGQAKHAGTTAIGYPHDAAY
ncbi:allantoate deiminase, partial [Enterococcus faecalis]